MYALENAHGCNYMVVQMKKRLTFPSILTLTFILEHNDFSLEVTCHGFHLEMFN